MSKSHLLGLSVCVSIAMMLSVASIASAGEKVDWKAAVKEDSVSAYRKFLETYPETKRKVEIETFLKTREQSSWNRAASNNSEASYQEFLEQFPNSMHASEATKRLSELTIGKAKASAEEEKKEKRLHDYQIDKLTLEQFRNDGWNESEALAGRLGIIGFSRGVDSVLGSYNTYTLGRVPGGSAQSASAREISERRRSFLLDKPDSTPVKYINGDGVPECVLLFESGILTRIEWKK